VRNGDGPRRLRLIAKPLGGKMTMVQTPRPMTLAEAQREVQFVFLGGAVGQLVSGAIWLSSAALGTWVGVKPAILTVVIGGMFIFPLTQLLLRTLRRPWTLSSGNPLRPLAIQIAFTVPLTLPVVAGAALHNINWFYPGCAVIVGAHYLPFTFLYGMWQYALLSGVLMTGGLGLGMRMPESFTPAGWLTGTVLVFFAGWLTLSGFTRRSAA